MKFLILGVDGLDLLPRGFSDLPKLRAKETVGLESFAVNSSRHWICKDDSVKISGVVTAQLTLVARYFGGKTAAKYFIPSNKTKQEYLDIAIVEELKKEGSQKLFWTTVKMKPFTASLSMCKKRQWTERQILFEKISSWKDWKQSPFYIPWIIFF